MSAGSERTDRLCLDIDTRVLDIWATAEQEDSVLLPMLEVDEMRAAFACCLRVAYGQGYADALREDREGRRGELCRTHGYRTP